MRRTIFAGIPAVITALAALFPAASAQARDPAPYTPGTFLNRCVFPFDVAPVIDKEYQTVRTLADGTEITQTTGKLVLSFTNDITHKTIVRDVSGPTTFTVHPDGSGTAVGQGNNVWTVGPVGQATLGLPGLLFTNGRAVFTFAELPIATSFSLSGTQVNGCALLAG